MKPGLKATLLCVALAGVVTTNAQPNNARDLSALVSGCTHDCEDDIFKKVWRHFEDATGLRTSVNTNSVRWNDRGGFMAVVYTGQPRIQLDPSKMRRFIFTCHGQYADAMAFPLIPQDFGPRSVGGDIEREFCSKTSTPPAQVVRSERLNQRLTLTGRIRTSVYQDCCRDGKETPTQYRYLQLDAPINFTDSDQGDENYRGVTKVQIDYRWNGFKTTPDGTRATIACSEVSEGGTGHYALPLFCWIKKPG